MKCSLSGNVLVVMGRVITILVALLASGNQFLVWNNIYTLKIIATIAYKKMMSSKIYKTTLGVTEITGGDNTHFNYPWGVTIDKNGAIFISDSDNHPCSEV